MTTRQFRAVVTGNKIPAGVPIDNRCVDEIIRLYGEAERLDKSASNAAEKAKDIMARFEGCLNRICDKTLREEYESMRPRIKTELHPLIK